MIRVKGLWHSELYLTHNRPPFGEYTNFNSLILVITPPRKLPQKVKSFCKLLSGFTANFVRGFLGRLFRGPNIFVYLPKEVLFYVKNKSECLSPFDNIGSIYWVSQNLSQICTASAYVYRKSILQQLQYIFAVNFGTLSMWHWGNVRKFIEMHSCK